MRQYCRAPGKAALQCILQIEQTEVILAPLTHHNLGAEFDRVGIYPPRLTHQLALQRLGKGRNPHRAVGLLCPERGRGEIAQSFANPCARLSQQHIGFAFAQSGRKDMRRRSGKGALTIADFGIGPNKRCQLRLHRVGVERDLARRGARWRFLPFGQFGKQPAFGLVGLFERGEDGIRPRPTQPHERLRAVPCALALGPCRVRQRGEEGLRCGEVEEAGKPFPFTRIVIPAKAGIHHRTRRHGIAVAW